MMDDDHHLCARCTEHHMSTQRTAHTTHNTQCMCNLSSSFNVIAFITLAGGSGQLQAGIQQRAAQWQHHAHREQTMMLPVLLDVCCCMLLLYCWGNGTYRNLH